MLPAPAASKWLASGTSSATTDSEVRREDPLGLGEVALGGELIAQPAVRDHRDVQVAQGLQRGGDRGPGRARRRQIRLAKPRDRIPARVHQRAQLGCVASDQEQARAAAGVDARDLRRDRRRRAEDRHAGLAFRHGGIRGHPLAMNEAGQNTIRRATSDDLEGLTVLFDGYRRFYGNTSDIEGARRFRRRASPQASRSSSSRRAPASWSASA